MSNFIGATQQYEKELAEDVKQCEFAILGGNVGTFDEYKRLVGKRQGILQCLERHKELVALMENYDEDRAS